MRYIDYYWDLSETVMSPDPELNTNELQWKVGDLWTVLEVNGKKFLKKIANAPLTDG